jgi:lipopolysaccharide export system protein LptA
MLSLIGGSLFAGVEKDVKHTKKPVVLKQPADSLVVTTKDGSTERTLHGHIWLNQGTINLFSEYAQQTEETNTVILKKNVVVKQGTLNLYTNDAVYYGFTQMAYASNSVNIIDRNTTLVAASGSYDAYEHVADFIGKVVVENDSAIIFADHVTYFRKDRTSFVDGNAHIFGKFTNAVIRADSIRYFSEKSYAIAKGIPVLFQIDTTNKKNAQTEEIKLDTMTISANKMEAFLEKDKENYICTGTVEINKDSLIAKCKKAIYNKYLGEIYLIGSPIIWYAGTQTHADSVCLRFENNKIKQIRSFGNAITMMHNDSLHFDRIDQITGDTLFVDFENNKINGLYCNGQAKSLYFYSDEKGLIGADKTSTNKITISFTDGKAAKINWLGSSEKEFIDGNTLFAKEKDYYLSNFKWYDEKPLKKFLFFKC